MNRRPEPSPAFAIAIGRIKLSAISVIVIVCALASRFQTQKEKSQRQQKKLQKIANETSGSFCKANSVPQLLSTRQFFRETKIVCEPNYGLRLIPSNRLTFSLNPDHSFAQKLK